MTPEERDAIESGTYTEHLSDENCRLNAEIDRLAIRVIPKLEAEIERLRSDVAFWRAMWEGEVEKAEQQEPDGDNYADRAEWKARR